ncbi:RAMP superfamily CRISPR-associated protein [Cylindrospermopsis raciborskii]|uniref:Type III-B CRISPR module RAMP protein Cmr4 n=1 Tax=Cylindrospermopsis raciborskii CENA302 TaxID=1170768 RepID=A0A9Q5R065_9CYAN|nr:RAMP superfamily CRISPR-associated protein [Cylindrospermopsis raciborskii]OPH11402.1 type III-B CRISPR module RAMP protein Cmr4 [Cylindrospermopsis raciborskii CENA302]
MYHQAYGIIKTLAPLHVGATAGEETGNMNLIFRDQFTRTGIIPGSSIRGRLRAEMRYYQGEEEVRIWYGSDVTDDDEQKLSNGTVSNRTTESRVKFEYASIVWLPVFCPGQPIIWVSCKRLLKRYQRIAGLNDLILPRTYVKSESLTPLPNQKLFFNFGFLTIANGTISSNWFPDGEELPAVIVGDDEISMIHDMALYRQSRVALEKNQKRNADKAFFGVEALPEETILAFPIGLKKNRDNKQWEPFGKKEVQNHKPQDSKAKHDGNNDKKVVSNVYLGGLESVGFGQCQMTLFNTNVRED